MLILYFQVNDLISMIEYIFYTVSTLIFSSLNNLSSDCQNTSFILINLRFRDIDITAFNPANSYLGTDFQHYN